MEGLHSALDKETASPNRRGEKNKGRKKGRVSLPPAMESRREDLGLPGARGPGKQMPPDRKKDLTLNKDSRVVGFQMRCRPS